MAWQDVPCSCILFAVSQKIIHLYLVDYPKITRIFAREEQNPFANKIHNVLISGTEGKDHMEEYDLLQCIEKGLEPFGSHVKQSIFWKMSILHNYSRNEVSENPGLLTSVIKETLNDSSAAVEDSIAAEIRKKFNLPYKEAQNMGDAIKLAKRQIIGVYAPVPTA